ncbi:DUF5825 family protein [Kitasatospora sp. NPDC048365]|uniref:DUF5825 family protein n=1 Tax=Kitasatospora sp. NPDC048365 TaxID=3364050 RepID=UPI00371FF68E
MAGTIGSLNQPATERWGITDAIEPGRVEALVERWREYGLLFEEAGSYLQVAVEAWRDHDPVVRALPGMALGVVELAGPVGESVGALRAAGARYVRLPEPVRLCADADPLSARALLLLRELTAQGLAVDWTATCSDGCAADRTLAHLLPPLRIEGRPLETARTWQETWTAASCVFRRGPGFVEVRDRRFGPLDLYTIGEPGHLAAIGALLEGAPVGSVPDALYAELAEARLVARHGATLWWLPLPLPLPLPVRRWPFGSEEL